MAGLNVMIIQFEESIYTRVRDYSSLTLKNTEMLGMIC